MNYYVLSDSRCQQIAKAARVIWADFLDEFPQFSPDSILSPAPEATTFPVAVAKRVTFHQKSFPRNECVTAFFQHCADTVVEVPGLVLNQMSLQGFVSNVRGSPTSWLVDLTSTEVAYDPAQQTVIDRNRLALVLVDLNYLLKQDTRNPERIWVCLLLHEIGHLVLHWDEFRKQRAADGKTMATDQQEAEAWFFQSVILGLALGSYAHSCVKMPRRSKDDFHEDAWKFVV